MSLLPRSKKQLTILFIPLDAFGHVHASIGIAEPLKQRGHRIVFGVAAGWKGKLSPYGFEELFYGEETKPSQVYIDFVEKYASEMKKNSYDQLAVFEYESRREFIRMVKNDDLLLREVVKKVKPDIIIVDHYVCQPSLVTAGVPWVWLLSANPLGVSEENCPPRSSGYPTDGDRSQWDRFRQEITRIYDPLWHEFNQWLIKQGVPPLTKERWPFFQNASPYLNIYLCPKELDYTDLRPNPPNWFRCDALVRSPESNQHFHLPQQLANQSGKLIYMSMGSMTSADLVLMKRLINILQKSPHRFIVSKGPLGDQYSLPDHMWGENIVPQVNILPIVDLVITHGGNNTVTESLYFGKPLIVLPIFHDQLDNAQRIEEKGFGIRLDAYHCTEEQLLHAIETLLSDKELAEKLNMISKQIRDRDSRTKAAELIEALG